MHYSTKTDIQRNKLMHLEDALVMYRVYSAETLEKLIKTVHMYIADNTCMKVYLQEK